MWVTIMMDGKQYATCNIKEEIPSVLNVCTFLLKDRNYNEVYLLKQFCELLICNMSMENKLKIIEVIEKRLLLCKQDII